MSDELENIENVEEVETIPTDNTTEELQENVEQSTGEVSGEVSGEVPEDNSAEIIQDDILARLISLPNVVITSHQGYLTKEALENIAETTLENISAYFNGEYLDNEICYHCQKKAKDCFMKRKMRCW